jgi:hypothetical protein
MKCRLTALGLIAISHAAHAFDIEAYCRSVGAAAGGGAQLEAVCREQEQAARNVIDRMTAPPHTRDYCQQVGQSAGGSYQIMEACLEEEAKAGDKLK